MGNEQNVPAPRRERKFEQKTRPKLQKKDPLEKNNKKNDQASSENAFLRKKGLNPSVFSSPANAAVITKMCALLGFSALDAKNVNIECVQSHGLLQAPSPCLSSFFVLMLMSSGRGTAEAFELPKGLGHFFGSWNDKVVL